MGAAHRLVLLTFSNTGNTQYVAAGIGDAVRNAGCEVDHVDLLALVKVLDLGNQQKRDIKLPRDKPAIYEDAVAKIGNATVVGLGTFANAWGPSPGIAEVFSESVLPHELFTQMQLFFTYATAGQTHGHLSDALASLLGPKNWQARFVGSLEVLAPENFVPLMPARPFVDVWLEREKAKIVAFGLKLSAVVRGEVIPDATYRPREAKRGYLVEWALEISGRPVCDKSKCAKCGICVEVCPYNAISFDVEDGFPSVDRSKCRVCGRCRNFCRTDAMEFPRVRSDLRSKFAVPVLIVPGQRTAEGFIGQEQPFGLKLNSRWQVGCGRGPLAVLVAVLLFVGLGVAWGMGR